MQLLRHSLALFAVLAMGATASAHVKRVAPNGGETSNAGDSVSIDWTILIAHQQQNWDLEYSTTGPTGPWLPIAFNLPAGSTQSGSTHSYLWTVPDTPSTKVRVRVTMDNAGTDYKDKSNQNFTIIGTPATDCNANGELDATDIATGFSSDFDGDGIPDDCQSLSVDVASLSVSAGGTQSLSINVGASHAGALFLIAGSLSGSTPGTPFGALIVPLNFDAYTAYTLANANTPPLIGTFGVLDASGQSSSQLTATAGSLDPSLVGLSVRHAAIVFGGAPGTDTVTNWMPLTLTL